jgi:hypothetical protein
MENKKLNSGEDMELAEKCRKALENDLGFAIPMPNSKFHKANQPKQKAPENVEIVQKENTHPQNRTIEALSLSQELDKKTLESLGKINEQKRLSTNEFQRLYDIIWKKGPESRVQNPDAWFRRSEA